MELPEEKRLKIREAIFASRQIEAIKLGREATGCELKEAKDFVEQHSAELYAKDPQKFSSPPKGKGCLGVAVMAGLLVMGWIAKTLR